MQSPAHRFRCNPWRAVHNVTFRYVVDVSTLYLIFSVVFFQNATTVLSLNPLLGTLRKPLILAQLLEVTVLTTIAYFSK